MIESLIKNAREGWKLPRWMCFFPPGLLLIVAAAGFAGGRLMWIQASRPAHRLEIATAYGATRDFYGVPQINHAGSQFAYVATADTRGNALFLYDIASSNRRELVCDKTGSGYWQDTFNLKVWPWSPDDNSVIYSVDNKLFVCPIDTNQPPVQVATGTNAAVSDVTWLSPQQFVWLEGTTP
jgi:hypothetical protein